MFNYPSTLQIIKGGEDGVHAQDQELQEIESEPKNAPNYKTTIDFNNKRS